jgi:hypothetical protein
MSLTITAFRMTLSITADRKTTLNITKDRTTTNSIKTGERQNYETQYNNRQKTTLSMTTGRKKDHQHNNRVKK